jgi:hypothetical protein
MKIEGNVHPDAQEDYEALGTNTSNHYNVTAQYQSNGLILHCLYLREFKELESQTRTMDSYHYDTAIAKPILVHFELKNFPV